VRPSAVIFLVAMCIVVACASPETGRSRGGGPGADTGNRTKVVRMHEGADPFYKTPKLIPSKAPPLTSARHADNLSR